MAIEKIAEASSEERNQLRGFIALHAAESFPDAHKFQPARGTAACGIGRRLQEKRLQITRQFFQLVVHAHESVCVARRKFAELTDSASAVRPPRHHLPIWKRN